MSVRILIGDCRERMRDLPDASVDSVVCDPPYHLTAPGKGSRSNLEQPKEKDLTAINAGAFRRLAKGFMGQEWDGGDVAFDPGTWAEVLRVLKPGGHLVAFSGTRTYHRMAVAIEDSGFEIRDQLAWVYGSGFPKSLDVSKAIDKAAGAEREVVALAGSDGVVRKPRTMNPGGGATAAVQTITAPATEAAQQWQGWGTALKPSWEPICLARKPLDGTVANNVLTHGTGALNIDGCRIEHDEPLKTTERDAPRYSGRTMANGKRGGVQSTIASADPQGRWPANLCHDGSDEVLAGFPETESGALKPYSERHTNATSYQFQREKTYESDANSGSAARFFYCAKATTEERGEGNNHPTVKPVALMRWLCRLVTPKGGTVLDPFMGSGSTGLAADAEQFNFVGCEMSPEYAAIAERRIKAAAGMFAEVSIAA